MNTKIYYEETYEDKEYYELNKPRITSVEDWKIILKNEIEYNQNGFDFINYVLAEVYYSPDKTVFCKELEQKNNIKGINLRVGEFKDRIRKLNKIQFEEQIRSDTGTDRSWNIPFYSNEKLNNLPSNKGKFSWVLRDELAQAMEELELVGPRFVMTFPINGTEDIIEKYKIHAHPVKRGYPKKKTPFIAFRIKGTIKKIYKIHQIEECLLNNLESMKNKLTKKEYEQLYAYVMERKETFGFDQENIPYRFYIFEEYHSLYPDFQVDKNYQNAKIYNLDELITTKEGFKILSSDNLYDEIHKKQLETENLIEDDQLNREILQEIKLIKNFKYSDECSLRNDPINTKGTLVYKRDKQKAINALSYANFQCEINQEHKSFKRKIDSLPYMEAHHLIPMSKQILFEYSIDIEENIVSLCSHCHNEIHYGENAKELIKKLYYKRKDLLQKKNVHISLEELLSYYE